MILADKIIRLRRKNGWSQEELAEKMNVSRQAVSKWEMGQSVPTPRNLEGIEAVLDLPVGTLAELLKEEEREPSSPKISKKCILLTSVVGVAVLVMAFSLGWFVSQQSSASHGGGTVTWKRTGHHEFPVSAGSDRCGSNRSYSRGWNGAVRYAPVISW